MSWTDLFKSKSSKLKPDPRIRWFGKLPTYADYYSSTTDANWAVEFNDWVLKGYQVYQSRVSGVDHDRRLPISTCVIRLPKSGMTVFSSIQDYGGDMRGRPFPICFYVGVPTVQWPGPTSHRLASAARAVRDLTALRREVPHFLNSPGRFEAVFGEREIDLSGIDGETEDASWMGQTRKVMLADWFAGAKAGLQTEDPHAWFRYVARWGDNIARLESKTFEPTLRFPLALGLPVEAQMAGWLHWLELRMDLARRSLSLIVCDQLESSMGQLGVIAREVVPEDFLLLTQVASTLPYVDDLCAATTEEESSGEGVQASADSTDAFEADKSWADFVESPARVP